MYIKRDIEKCVLEASKYYPVVMVCGQRQVGKSTMLNHIKEENRKYVSLDDRNAFRLAETDPLLFLQTYGYPLIIDEFQKVPSLLEAIKDIVDKLGYEGKDNNGIYWLTGSQKFKMMKNVSESLAGRICVLEMSSLSQSEIAQREGYLFSPSIEDIVQRFNSLKARNANEIYEAIFNGGMPKLVTTAIDRERFYSDYVNTYLERDIKSLEKIGKLNEFYDFLVYMAARTSKELKYADISRDIGVSAPTVKEWITILERAGIIFILRPYYSSITNRLVKTPKFYFMDTGLAAYLARWPDYKSLANGNMDGAFLETFVVSEIVKNYYNNGKPVNNLYYYRDIDQREIDLLIVTADSIFPIEIKKNAVPNHPDKNFYVLNKFGLEIKTGIIFCLSEEMVPYNKQCWLVPVSFI